MFRRFRCEALAEREPRLEPDGDVSRLLSSDEGVDLEAVA